MRRSDREIKDINAITSVLDKCDVCRIGLVDVAGRAYIVPLNFAYRFDGGKLELYFHSATEGKKVELIGGGAFCAFEADCDHMLSSDPACGYCTMSYASVMGTGYIEPIYGDDKLFALRLLVDRYHKSERFEFDVSAVPRTAVYKLTVDEITGKARRKS